MTAPDDDRPSHTDFSFRIYSDNLTAVEITALVGLQPDETCRKDDFDERYPELGLYPHHGWFLDSTRHVDPAEPLDVQLTWLADFLEPALDGL